MGSEPLDFARGLAAAARSAGCGVTAVYLHGSAALGGWVAARSDVDVLVLTAGAGQPGELSELGRVLLAAAAGCPGRGLECSVVTAAAAARPAPPWPFLLHLHSETGGTELIRCEPGGGDADLLMHYAVCLAAGLPLLGPPPAESIGPVDRAAILAYLAEELGWGLAHATESYAVLNACRALVYLRDGRIVSKLAGGYSALRSDRPSARLIGRALAQQEGRAPERPPGPDAIAFVQRAARALRRAAPRP